MDHKPFDLDNPVPVRVPTHVVGVPPSGIEPAPLAKIIIANIFIITRPQWPFKRHTHPISTPTGTSM